MQTFHAPLKIIIHALDSYLASVAKDLILSVLANSEHCVAVFTIEKSVSAWMKPTLAYSDEE